MPDCFGAHGGYAVGAPIHQSASCNVTYTKAKKTDPEAHQQEIAERALEEVGGVAGW